MRKAADIDREINSGITGQLSAEVANLRTANAALRAEVAELRKRPVLTVESLADAWCAAGSVKGTPIREHVEGLAVLAMPKLGPVILPAQDRAEELLAAFAWRMSNGTPVSRVDAMRAALAKLVPAPAKVVGPLPDHHDAHAGLMQLGEIAGLVL